MMRYGWNGYGSMAWGIPNIIGVIASVVFWILIFVAFVSFIRWMSYEHRGSMNRGEKGDNALGILKERYVKGEITKKEFDEMKKDIS